MPKIIVATPFLFAEDGNYVVEIGAGEQDVSDRCALVAVDQLKVARLATSEKAEAKPRSKK